MSTVSNYYNLDVRTYFGLQYVKLYCIIQLSKISDFVCWFALFIGFPVIIDGQFFL